MFCLFSSLVAYKCKRTFPPLKIEIDLLGLQNVQAARAVKSIFQAPRFFYIFDTWLQREVQHLCTGFDGDLFQYIIRRDPSKIKRLSQTVSAALVCNKFSRLHRNSKLNFLPTNKSDFATQNLPGLKTFLTLKRNRAS